MKRIKLCDRTLPCYLKSEERMNMVTHIVGGGIGIIALVLCLLQAGSVTAMVGGGIYGMTMVALYAMSSIYHGLPPGTGKKVMQILDHCAIYFLIAGTYTPILLCGIIPLYPRLGWGLLAGQWGLCLLATVFTAIDLRASSLFSMVCYILMGWAIIFFAPQAIHTLRAPGFALLLAGGIAYTVGAVLYGVGVRVRWMHAVFHIFVVIGSVLQLLSILLYVL